MTGKEVRETLLNNGIVLSELADKLGISAQTLNSRLNAKSFKMEYLNEIQGLTGITFESTTNNDLLSIIASQQRTIESLSKTIENLSRR